MNAIPTWFKGLLIGALVGFVLHHVYEAGAEAERSKWLVKSTLQIVSNQTEQMKKDAKIRKLENRLAASALETFTYYQGVFNENQAEKQRALNGVHDGTLRLSIPTTGNPTACQDSVGGSATDRPQAATETRAELSTEAAEFLIGYGAEFDEVVIESNKVKDLLTDCRAALVELRLILGE